VAVGEQRVFGAVEHQGRHPNLAEARPQGPAPVQDPVVLHARFDVGRPLDDPADECSHLLLVERDGSGKRGQVLEDVVDHGLSV
jgi:hypothetical protein